VAKNDTCYRFGASASLCFFVRSSVAYRLRYSIIIRHEGERLVTGQRCVVSVRA